MLSSSVKIIYGAIFAWSIGKVLGLFCSVFSQIGVRGDNILEYEAA